LSTKTSVFTIVIFWPHIWSAHLEQIGTPIYLEKIYSKASTMLGVCQCNKAMISRRTPSARVDKICS